MKKLILSLFLLLQLTIGGFAQNYNPVINYSFNGTPINGIKIKTKLPFTNGSQMPTIIIEGYNYGQKRTIGLSLVWYIYGGIFYTPSISSFGAYTPTVKLANENGYVSIFIDDRQYFNRFSIRAFAQGMSEQSSWFTNWVIVDEPLAGTNVVNVPYVNSFAGNISFPNGVWNSSGNVGIGTSNPQNALDVNGSIRAKEVKVTTDGWSDFVFKPEYKLRSLIEVEKYININGHLPEIPSEIDIKQSGINVGDMQAKLLQKVEELTLYIIELKKENIEKDRLLKEQQKLLLDLKKELHKKK